MSLITKLITKLDTKITEGVSVLLTFVGLRNDSKLRSLAYEADFMNVKPGTTGFEHPVGSKLWQH